MLSFSRKICRDLYPSGKVLLAKILRQQAAMLYWVLKEWGLRCLTGFNRHVTGYGGGSYEHNNKPA
jgi:hypothetical protein